MKYLLDRLKEPSTWRGLTILATVFGVHISPEQVDAIATVGGCLIGAIGAFTKG